VTYPIERIKRLAEVASETFTATSSPIHYAAVKALEGGPFLDDYLVKARKVLKTILKYILTRFDKLQITYPVPQGAFYIFPDSGRYREKFDAMGIHTSKQLCSRILEDTGVAMLPGSDFGRDALEFYARIADVDFNGREGMDAADMLFREDSNYDDFVEKHCPKEVTAVERLREWLTR
jgi:aspartate/methionine/tyrosine aminotransferase